MFNFLIVLIALMVTFSEATCPNVFLSAVHNRDIKGEISIYQDSKGAIWITGVYQWGFQSPQSWTYDWTIRNGCKDVAFNLTSYLHTEYTKDSGCNGYPDDNIKSNLSSYR
ncbi:hypothetical protein C2G38_2168162 [Gigaspora rosea]|uniref:Uncharacterized protein n=1 Tax=Gigaspora rosea TaxID=44941 RepID=A0A397VQ32_9GLOM|nr:hypothetical protein C2G38_2168162 [Gigaspora rosea]